MKKKKKIKRQSNKTCGSNQFEKLLPIYIFSILLYFYLDHKVIGISNSYIYLILILSILTVLGFSLKNWSWGIDFIFNLFYRVFAVFSFLYSIFFLTIFMSRDKEITFVECEIIGFKQYGNDGLIYLYNGKTYSNNYTDDLIYEREDTTYFYMLRGNKSIFDSFYIHTGHIVKNNVVQGK